MADDITFYCDGTYAGVEEAGIPQVVATMHGDWINWCVIADPMEVVVCQVGSYPSGFFVSDGLMEVVVAIPTSDTDVYIQGLKSNWIKWSNIGYMDFTIGKKNVSGERPMDWSGWTYGILKLDNRPVVYGKNGVSIIPPHGQHFGLQTIYRIGLKNKQSLDGDDSIHFFIDNKDQLFQHTGEGLKLLDYSEYLSSMGDTKLSYDKETGFVYICDGTYGFVYSSRDGSMGKGPINITGLGSKDGTLYVTAPATISTPDFEVWTDIYDMGTGRGKSIQSIEVRTDVEGALYASVDYRRDKSADFLQTDWYELDERGMAYITVYGEEFRFGVKNNTYEWFTIDEIIVRGEVHDN